MESSLIKGYKQNPTLQTLITDLDWLGTSVDRQDRFLNLTHPYTPSFCQALRWQLQPNPKRQLKKKAAYKPLVVTGRDSPGRVWFEAINQALYLAR